MYCSHGRFFLIPSTLKLSFFSIIVCVLFVFLFTHNLKLFSVFPLKTVMLFVIPICTGPVSMFLF